jgi:VanZ family protein
VTIQVPHSVLTSLISIARTIPGRLLPPLVWMGVIYLLSDQPTLPYPQDLDSRLVSIAGHFSVFGVLAVLFWWALGLAGEAGTRRKVSAVALVVLYGVVDEWHQSFVPGRTPDVYDVLTDATGAIVAMLVVTWIERRGVFRAWEGKSEAPSPSR